MSIRTKIIIITAVLLHTMTGLIPLLAEQTSEYKPATEEFIQKIQRLRIPFIINAGQTHEKVKFYVHTFGGSVFITTDNEIVYSLPASKTMGTDNFSYRVSEIDETIPRKDADYKPTNYQTHFLMRTDKNNSPSYLFDERSSTLPTGNLALKEEFTGGKINTVKGERKAAIEINHFRGNDPSKWRRNISAYEVVNLGEVYKGIKIKLRAYGNNVEKLFYIKPHAAPEAIKIKLSGAHALSVNDAGQLEAETDLGSVRFTKPVAYQTINGKRVAVAVEYRIPKSKVRTQNTETNLSNQKSGIQHPQLEYGFTIAKYDNKRELVIDPLLASTYLGGFESDYGNSIAIDSGKNVFVAGYTKSSDFPTTAGTLDNSYSNGDIFVSKLSADLTRLLASTYLGGSSDDYVRSLVIDSSKNIYMAGQTSSSDFPTTVNTCDTSKNGFSDGFLVRLSSDLTHLLSSTFLGGSSDDSVHSITVDPSGIILCVTGRTLSSDFPVTPGAYDTRYKNGDVFVSKVTWNLTRILASTFLGGTNNDFGNSIAIDSNRNIFVGGDTWSSDFPVSDNAYDTSFNGGFGDVFVSKLNWDLTQVLASTYLGGATDDSANSIAIDPRGNIYVAGETESLDFPTTHYAYETSFRNGDAFVSRLNGNLTKLLASTFLGGADDDVCNSIAIDQGGNVYMAGHTASSDFPTTPDSYCTSKSVYFDAFITKLSGDLTNLLASTFLGGNYRDIARSIVIDPSGNVYVTGETLSANFPATPGVYDTSYNGDASILYNVDAFVSKLDSNLSASTTTAKKGNTTGLIKP